MRIVPGVALVLACSALLSSCCHCHCTCDCKDKKSAGAQTETQTLAPAPTVGYTPPVRTPAEDAPVAAPANGKGDSIASGPHVGEAKRIPLGINGNLNGERLLSPESVWNQKIDKEPVDPKSAVMIAGIGADAPLHPDFGSQYHGTPWGVPYVVVSGDTPRTSIQFDYADESDAGPYPIPANFQIEGSAPNVVPSGTDNDQHLLIIDRDHAKLYELYLLRKEGGTWRAGSGAIFDLLGDTHRQAGWTSADAGGLPVMPGLVRQDEAERGSIEHALRFTTRNSRKGYTFPATHWASNKTDPNLPPMGARLRLKSSVKAEDFPQQMRAVIVALQKYGMILADNGGSLFLSGAPNSAWHDNEIETLKRIHARDFEVVKLGHVTTP